ncbi:MAG: DNA internalization-related competence protein ComEC/Rec2 [Saccharospirillaceae bacterium]|nr:DNA internalization-related competence protein ComEC/Rec2 [Saccharospirillaceae bacterium]
MLDGTRQRHSAAAWPWLSGLVFGEQQAFSKEQWQLAQFTGTLHLLVVSGLHVGMVAAIGWLLALFAIRLWILLTGRGLRHPALIRLLLVGAVSAAYVWLAGTGIALQRAWIMIMVLLWVLFSGWRLNWLTALSLALLLVLLVNPLIWTRAGFGFSFVAVLSLLAFFGGRSNGRLQTFVLPQWVVFMAMLPLLWFWGLPVSLLQVFTNLLAIPLLSLLILPLALLDVGLAWLSAVFMKAGLLNTEYHAAFVAALDSLLAGVGETFWQLLTALQQQNWPLQFWQPLPVLLLWPVMLLLWRLGVSPALNWAATPLLLLGLFWPWRDDSEGVAYSSPEAAMLDVGQGQSLVFISGHHVLVYDTGARFSAHFDAGSALLVPLLKQAGVTRIDTLIVSHSDLDHAGGLDSVLRSELPVQKILLGQMLAEVPPWRSPVACRAMAEQGWQVIDAALHYRILALPTALQVLVAGSDNNQSCVVQLDWFGRRFLLTGDIERDLEQQLVAHFGVDLRSDVLVLAHHGSRSSSSAEFLAAVQPSQVWISAGFNNRFGHPHADVIRRLDAMNIPWYLTARDGALFMAPDGQLRTARSGWQPPWRQP